MTYCHREENFDNQVWILKSGRRIFCKEYSLILAMTVIRRRQCLHKMLPGSFHYSVLTECTTTDCIMSMQNVKYDTLFRNTENWIYLKYSSIYPL